MYVLRSPQLHVTESSVQDMSTVRSTEADQSWWLNRIPLNQLVLLEIRNVSPGSWQPVILWRL